MTLFKKLSLLCALWAALSTPAMAQDPQPIDANRVIGYIDSMVGWDNNLNTLDSMSLSVSEATIRNYLHQDGDKLVRLLLDYAKAQNAVFTAGGQVPAADKNGAAPTLAKVTADNAAAIARLQGEVAGLNRRISGAPRSQRVSLTGQRDKLQAQLNLMLAQRDLLTSVSGTLTANKSNDSTEGLPGKIVELAKLVPVDEAVANQAKTTVKTPAAPTKPEAKTDEAAAEDNGIFTLAGNMADMLKKRTRVRDIIGWTDALQRDNQDHVAAVRAELRSLIARGNAIGADVQAAASPEIAAQRQELDQLTVRFRLLSAVIAPLAEQSVWIEAAQRGLNNWNKQIDEQFTTTLRALIMRLVLLTLAIIVPLFLSRLATRGINKYVGDDRRRRQLKVVQHAVVIFVIVMLICLNFLSEFGSLATYAGLITAGIAIALQNVILSIVAHFFFFGRYSVQVGDRVTVNGVTGNIIELGLVRFYMMELDNDNATSHPTGRIVAFPNSILFQQSAFYKQIPGTHYSWRTVTVSLPQNIDYARAQEKLLAAINGVYAGYRSEMETQQSILESSTRLKVRLPQPEGNLKFVGSGMAFEARYPVEMGRSAEIDDSIAQSILSAMQKDAELGQDGTPMPQIQPA